MAVATANLGTGYGMINLSIGQGVLSRNALARRNRRSMTTAIPDSGKTIAW